MDVFFYHSPELVPFNIVRYNLFGGSDRGPDIFGTEPWHFYLRNLLLNFNVWFLLAFLAFPLMLLRSVFGAPMASSSSRLRGLVFVSPFYLWLLIFTLQPHKEERFMYPAYPALGMNAAVSLHFLLSLFGNPDPRTLVGRIPPSLKLVVVASVGLVSVAAGLLRALGTVTAYSAPMQIHKALQDSSLASQSANICYGKEWYRYPSSFFLPDGFRAKFVKSNFDGLLPGEFSEAQVGFGFWPTWLVPSGMNDRNQEDPGKYVCILRPVDEQHRERWKLIIRRSTSAIAHIWWTRTFPNRPKRYPIWSQHMFLTKRPGRRSLVVHFWMLVPLAWLGGCCGFPIVISFPSSFEEDGDSIACYVDGENKDEA